MSHELDTASDGRVAFAGREPAWHRLGTVTGQAMTATEALSAAHMAGWEVRTEPVGTAAVTGTCQGGCTRKQGESHKVKCPVLAEPHPDGSPRTDRIVSPDDTVTVLGVPGWYATVRTSPFTGDPEPLGCVGSGYTPVQNEQLAEWMLTLADVSGAVFETAGSLRGGQDVFLTMRVPDHILIGGVDPVDLYLAGLNNHSGRSRLQVVTTPVRVVCANTERAALANHRSHYAIRHTQGIQGRIAEAREALNMTFAYSAEFQVEADAMINTKMTADQFDALIRDVWPDKFTEPAEKWRAPTTEHFETVHDLFRQADTQENIRNTVWAGYQSIVEYCDWFVPVQGQAAETPDLKRAERTYDGQYDAEKNTAWRRCRDLVTAS